MLRALLVLFTLMAAVFPGNSFGALFGRVCLDFEPPDAYFGPAPRYDYYENGEMNWREADNQFGTHALAPGGRHASSVQCLKVDFPADSRGSSQKNRREWALVKWQPGNEYWAGWSTKFASDFPTNIKRHNITQWKNSGTYAQVFIGYENGNLVVLCMYDKMTTGKRRYIRPGFSFTRGKWHDFVVNLKINNGAGSFLKIWIDGKKVVDDSGPIGFSDCPGNGHQKLGLYAYAHNARRVVYHDDLRYGDSYEDVDPSIDRFGNTVNPPAIFPLAGTYVGPQSISTSTSTSGAELFYTTDGSSPTHSSWPYSAPFEITASATVKVRAYKDGLQPSIVSESAYEILPLPAGYIPAVKATAGAHDGNGPENVIDMALATRWSAEGDPQLIQFDLGSSRSVGSVWLAWYKGNSRTADFEIQVSGNGSDWTTVYDGQSSGSTLELERYSFTSSDARYVRVVGHGNSSNDWNSLTEVLISKNSGSTARYPGNPTSRQRIRHRTAPALYTITGRRITSQPAMLHSSVYIRSHARRESQSTRLLFLDQRKVSR